MSVKRASYDERLRIILYHNLTVEHRTVQLACDSAVATFLLGAVVQTKLFQKLKKASISHATI